jgi:putative ABC transport system permease protein
MRFLKKLQKRRQLDQDLEDELRFHLEQSGDVHRFGNATVLKEACREMWTFTWIETVLQDIRYGARTLAKAPAVTLVAVLALALGIGANTTIFTVVNSLLAFRMGVGDIERLVSIQIADTGQDWFPAAALLIDLRPQIKTLDTLFAYRLFPANVSDGAALPERYTCVQITQSGFALISKPAVLGRAFTDDDERSNAAPVVILTHRVWQSRYGGDRNIIGKTIRVNEVPRSVIGVMPPGIQFPEDTDLWIPVTRADLSDLRVSPFMGRLAPGVRAGAAQAEFDALARNLTHQYPDRYKSVRVEIHPLIEMIGIYGAKNILHAMELAVMFVLLIACADVTNLLLARASARAREISIRIAIGAGRIRILRQLLIESMMLSSIGGFFGWFIALAGLRSFDRFLATRPGMKPSWIDLSINTEVLIYLTAVSLGTGILFGLAPALRLSKIDVNSAVKDGGLQAMGGSRGKLAGMLVVFQMVLCVVLLCGAGLLIRSSINLYEAPLGVEPHNVLTMQINLPEAKYPRGEDLIAFYRRLMPRLESLPGVETVAVASALPWRGFGIHNYACQIEGFSADPAPGRGPVVSSGYFRVMHLNPSQGRAFDEGKEPEVMVNQRFADRWWPSQDAVGKHIRILGTGDSNPWMTVAGVVPDVRAPDLMPLVYIPSTQLPQRQTFIVARTRVPPATLGDPFRREVQALDPNLPLYAVGTLDQRLSEIRLGEGVFAVLFSAFALIALVLGSVGLYAVVAHSVSRRTQEIGVRLALGGSRNHILSMVMKQGMRQVGLGIAIGIPVAFLVTKVLRSGLVGVEPGDPVTFVGVAAVLAGTGLLGCAIPARRAVRVDPVQALRHE